MEATTIPDPGKEPSEGTYAGWATRRIIDHLKSRFERTAIERRPVNQFMARSRLLDLGLRKLWGYKTSASSHPNYQYAIN